MTGPNVITKLCTKCNHVLAVSNFHKDSTAKDGLAWYCKSCVKAYQTEHKKRPKRPKAPDGHKWCAAGHLVPHSEFTKDSRFSTQLSPRCKQSQASRWQKIKAGQQVLRNAARKRNIDAYKERAQESYERTKEKCLARAKKHREANRHKIIPYLREYRLKHLDEERIRAHRYRQANKERLAKLKKEYSRQHPEVAKLARSNYHARKNNASGTCSPAQWVAKCEYWGWACYLCRVQLTPRSATIEHRIALSRGGTNWPANLAPACFRCNRSKSNLTEAQYRKRLVA